MSGLKSLLCGSEPPNGIAKKALGQLGLSIDTFAGKTANYLRTSGNPEILHFGSYCGRVLLENSCAAILGRLDPFRIFYLSEFQDQSAYEVGKKAHSSFSWCGDVLPDTNSSPQLWNIDNHPAKISRALLSIHYEHIYWKPAIEAAIDYLSSSDPNPDLSELTIVDSEKYITQTKGKISQVYSSLSKGVHWEFFTTSLVYDETTIQSDLQDVCTITSQLGFFSNFIPTAFSALKPQDAVLEYLEFRRSLA